MRDVFDSKFKEIGVAATKELEANEPEAQICKQQEPKLKQNIDILKKDSEHFKSEIETHFKVMQMLTLGEYRNCKF